MRNQDLWFSAWDIISCPSGVFHKKKKTPKPLLHPQVVEVQQNYTRVAEVGKLIAQKLRKFWIDQKVLLAAENKIANSWNLWCKFDAVCEIKGQHILYEVKSVGEEHFERIKKTGKPREDNRTQLIIYHYFLREKFPDLSPILLYVNRRAHEQMMEIPVKYSEEEIKKLKDTVDALRESIVVGKPLPPAPNLILDSYTNEYMVNPTAIICDWHGLCVGDNYWYPKAVDERERLNKGEMGND